MALEFDNSIAVSVNGNAGDNSFSMNIGNKNNRIAIINIQKGGGGGAPSKVTVGGKGAILAYSSGSIVYNYTYYVLNPPSGTNIPVVINANAVGYYAGATITTYSGASQRNPLVNFTNPVTGYVYGDPLTRSLTTTKNGSMVIFTVRESYNRTLGSGANTVLRSRLASDIYCAIADSGTPIEVAGQTTLNITASGGGKWSADVLFELKAFDQSEVIESVFSDDFDGANGGPVDSTKWTQTPNNIVALDGSGYAVQTPNGGGINTFAGGNFNTAGKASFKAGKGGIVIDAFMGDDGGDHDFCICIKDTDGDVIQIGVTSYQSMGIYSYGTGKYSHSQTSSGSDTTAMYWYRLDIIGTNLIFRRSDDRVMWTDMRYITLPNSIEGKTFTLSLGGGGTPYYGFKFGFVEVFVGVTPPIKYYPILNLLTQGQVW